MRTRHYILGICLYGGAGLLAASLITDWPPGLGIGAGALLGALLVLNHGEPMPDPPTCPSPHDPRPWELSHPHPTTRYTEPPSTIFNPRPGYCRNRDHYEPQLDLTERETPQ